ncbi:MAG: hypothetical protein AAF661_05040 [Pseudomonadota bacterium]
MMKACLVGIAAALVLFFGADAQAKRAVDTVGGMFSACDYDKDRDSLLPPAEFEEKRATYFFCIGRIDGYLQGYLFGRGFQFSATRGVLDLAGSNVQIGVYSAFCFEPPISNSILAENFRSWAARNKDRWGEEWSDGFVESLAETYRC